MGKGVGGVGGMWEVGGAGDGFGRGEERTAGGKKKRRVEIHPFHPELERKLEELRVAVAKGASPIPHPAFPTFLPSSFFSFLIPSPDMVCANANVFVWCSV